MRLPFLLIVTLCAHAAFGLDTGDVLFYAPLDGSANATLARGGGKAQAGGGVQFMPGVRGQALVVGGVKDAKRGTPGVTYETKGNILREQGSIALWVQALDWQVGDGANHQFVTIPGQGVTYYFYVFYPGNTWWLLLKKGGNRAIGGWVPRWKPGEWHHLVATWREGEMAVFVDGKQSGRATENVPLAKMLGGRFWLGSHQQPRTAFDELMVFRKPLAAAEASALYSKLAKPPAPATVVVSDNADSPAQLAGLLDDVTGQVVLDEDVTARLWADANALHVTLRWAIPEYFRRDPTAYSARALRRGSSRIEDDDAFEVRAGAYHAIVNPDGAPGIKSKTTMEEWLVALDIPRSKLGDDTFDFELTRHWRELRRLDATWRGKLTIRPGARTAQITTEDIRKLAAATPDDVYTALSVQVPNAYEAKLPFVRAAPFEACLRHYPSKARLVVEVTNPDAQASLVGETKSGAKELAFDVAKLPVGKHEVTVRLGKTVKKLTFERAAAPEWLTANAGMSDEVPPPWSPLEVDDKTCVVKCWGREYDFSGLLPQQIRSKGRPLLAAPMRLRVGDDEAEGTARVVSKGPSAVEIASRGALGPITVDVKMRMEFDGYVWLDLRLAPGEGSEANLGPLTLEMPMEAARATLWYSGSYTCKDTGTLPAEGYRGQWRPRFWVGDEEAGLQWFAESKRGWSITREGETLSIKDGLIHLSITDTSLTLAKPLEVSFGIMATPVRPRPKNWRSWRFGQDEVNRAGWRYVSLWNTHWGQRWNYPILKPTTAERLRQKYVDGELPCMYCNTTAFSPCTPEYRYWHEEWRVAPSARIDFASLRDDDENAHARVCPKSTFTEFYVWALEKAIKAADIRGLYFDVSDAPHCKNEAHGCGWRDENGKLHETVALRANREFQKRVYTVGKRHRSDFLVSIHMSGNITMPQHSFCDIMIDGENFTSILQRQWATDKRGDYFDFITLDKMRAEFMLHNFGPVPAFLPEFARSLGDRWWTDDPEALRAARHLVGLFTLHDAPLWQAYMPSMVLCLVWYAQTRFGWDEQVELIPYWRNSSLLTMEPRDPRVVASIFKRPGRIMIVAMNNTDKDTAVTLSWNAKGLGLEGKQFAKIEDFYTGAWWRLKDGVVPPIPLAARSFRMLVPVERR